VDYYCQDTQEVLLLTRIIESILSWTDISHTTASYTSGALSQQQFRAVVESGSCSSKSIATTVTVNPTTVGGIVTGGTTICAGSTNWIIGIVRRDTQEVLLNRNHQ
jgi:hypothetical protein